MLNGVIVVNSLRKINDTGFLHADFQQKVLNSVLSIGLTTIKNHEYPLS